MPFSADRRAGLVSLYMSVAIFAVPTTSYSAEQKTIDMLNSVPVYENGIPYYQSHGRHYAKDGYYYGKKWQCTEFVKRYYAQVYQHHMPDVMGNAKDFFDSGTPHRKLNKKRGLVQYRNNQDEPPKVGDLLVFDYGAYGHVAIVSEVTPTQIEVVQQNIYGKPRQKLELRNEKGRYSVLAAYPPAAWLRKP